MALTIDGAKLSLRLMYGDDHGALISDTITLHLGLADPRGDSGEAGAELDADDYPGYETGSVDNDSTNFPDPDAGGEMDSAALPICTATADWPTSPTFGWTKSGSTILDVVSLDAADFVNDGDDVTLALSLLYDQAAT